MRTSDYEQFVVLMIPERSGPGDLDPKVSIPLQNNAILDKQDICCLTYNNPYPPIAARKLQAVSRSAASMKTIKYRHIREKYGGTFSNYALTSPIGTRNCLTCVGVYFPVSDQECFVAHINAAVIPEDYLDYKDEYGNNYMTPRDCESAEEEEGIRNMVSEKLKQAAKAGGWKATGVDRTGVIVVCSEYDGEAKVGKVVVQAIRNFLGMGDELKVHDQCHGFVVDVSGGPPLLLEEKDFPGVIDMLDEDVDGVWEQLVNGEVLRFEAEDLPVTKDVLVKGLLVKGVGDWEVFFRDGAIPMVKRKLLVQDTT